MKTLLLALSADLALNANAGKSDYGLITHEYDYANILTDALNGRDLVRPELLLPRIDPRALDKDESHRGEKRGRRKERNEVPQERAIPEEWLSVSQGWNSHRSITIKPIRP